ncbi:MAG: ATP-binding cassette domain-containing protein [Pseudomonadota bacterium]
MAAPFLSLESVGLVQGSGWLLKDLDLYIAPRDRLALIGRNGAGKSTLFRLIAGLIEPDAGLRTQRPGTRIAMLAQDPDIAAFDTLEAFTLAGDDAPEAHEVAAVADQLGIDLTRPAATASGGERRRAALARTLASGADLLLLDEPTNHLDIAAIEWLEGWLERYRGAFIAISHDRAFLKRLTRSSLWLDRGRIRRAEIGFGGFEAWTEEVLAADARRAAKLDTKLAKEAEWLVKGVTARRKRNVGRLENLYRLRAERAEMLGQAGKAKLALTNDDAKTKIVIDAKNISKSYDGHMVIAPFDLRLQRGDRLGLFGPNGAGKTTLLKLLTKGIEPDTGRVRHAKTLSGIAIDQQRSILAGTRTVRDVLTNGTDWIDVRGERRHIVGYLKDFLFDRSYIDAEVSTLSGGERSRLLMAREFARPSNLLVLDEPTNDLDLETLDLLQEVIADYDGTVLLVSHDRDFLDRTVTMVAGLDGSGTVEVVAGGFADWQARRKPQKSSPSSSRPRADTAVLAPTKRAERMTFKDRHELDGLPDRIAALERDIAIYETALADPALYADGPSASVKLGEALAALKRDLAEAEDRWLALSEQAEAME